MSDEETSEYKKAREEAIAMKKEQERAGQAHARAVADHYEDVPAEEAERCPVTGKLRKKKSESEEEEQVAMSQLDINNYLANQYRQRMQNSHSQERMYRHGY